MAADAIDRGIWRDKRELGMGADRRHRHRMLEVDSGLERRVERQNKPKRRQKKLTPKLINSEINKIGRQGNS